MVAIVSGNGLGLLEGSAAALGQRGVLGSATQGKSGEGAFLNVATGNLVLQRRDDYLASRGLDVEVVRTYNAQGKLTDDNADNWGLGLVKRVTNLTGTLNTADSSITRIEGDGSETLYAYDASRNLYLSTQGAGAHDTLAYNSQTKQWVWTDGNTRNAETYDWAANGRIIASADINGNKLTYQYNASGLLSQVTDASNENTYFDYAGNNLTQIRVVTGSGTSAVTTTRVHYEYDANNRLSAVITDLTPDDNSIADGKTYVTRYTYDGDSKRIASLEQSDGTKLALSYEQAGANWRIKQVIDGEGRITRLDYAANGSTTVTDALGYQTVYTYDTKGQLTTVTGPQINGAPIAGVTRQIRYTYDAQGNVTHIVDGQNNTLDFEYDANGNQTLQRDAAGNTVRRTYGSQNQLLNETVYLVPDPDGSGAAQPTQGLTTRNVYDNRNQLRFNISPEGRVTEYRYNSLGERTSVIQYNGNTYDVSGLAEDAALSEAQLAAWVSSADKLRTSRTDYGYNARGLIGTMTLFTKVDAAGNGNIYDGECTPITYIYDQSGQLLQSIDVNSGSTSYAYDGLGRLLSRTNALKQATLTSYDDAHNSITTTLANGLSTTSVYNKAGELIGATQTDPKAALLGQTRYYYDADGRLRMTENPNGQRTYMLYDAAGRKIADIDADGSLVEYVYNGNDQLVRTIRYANNVDTALLVKADGTPADVALTALRKPDSGNDRTAWNSYDTAGRLVKSVDAQGYATQIDYDGASRAVRTVRYANAIDTTALGAAPAPTAINPIASVDDRITRSFYDKDGKLRGELDAEGYLTTYRYDAGGRLLETVSYVKATDVALRAGGSLAQLVPATDTNDIHQYKLYDGKGQLTGSIDGEGYLTEFVYDRKGNVSRKIRYATPVIYVENATVANLRPSASSEDQIVSYAYTLLDQLRQETAADGTVTQYLYDEVGNLVSTTRAVGTDPRISQKRYDRQGRVIAELSAEGAAKLTSTMTQAEIDAIWNLYAVKYQYDAAGQRIGMTDQNGNRTLFYYDRDGRLAATVNAMGEVETRTYNTYNELIGTRRFGTRLATETLAGLTGGKIENGFAAILAVLANNAVDSAREFRYDTRGMLSAQYDELGARTTFQYDAFGNVIKRSEQSDANNVLQHAYRYDHRGLQTQVTWDPSGLNTRAVTRYDAFGRAIENTDANGNTRTTSYDRLGRVIQVQDAGGNRTSTSYDAFDRVLTQTDSLGNVTRTTYNTQQRSITVITAEGIVKTVTYNRHGQQYQITDGNGKVTTFAYDKNGALLSITDALGNTVTNTYDRAGNLDTTRDGNNVTTSFKYDAANRVLTKTVDATGLNLVTAYSYDAKGQALTVTDPNGIVTRTEYDTKGQVRSVTVDPDGLNQITQFSYDGRGKTLQVIDANGHVTQYKYDTLGRRKQQIVDPDGLRLITSFAYDSNGNVIARTDANGNVTRFVYDVNGHMTYEVDAAGGVIEYRYDANGRVIQTLRYANPISLVGLATAIAQSDITSRLTPDTVRDNSVKNVYDRDGRLLFTIDGNGAVSRRIYDGNGNVIRMLAYAKAIAANTSATVNAVQAAVDVIADADRDALTIRAYDARNRVTAQVDSGGAVTTFAYDNNGNVLYRRAYANKINAGALAAKSSAADILAQVVADDAHDQQVRMVYDAANRMTASATAREMQWSVVRQTYDKNGNVVSRTALARPMQPNFTANVSQATIQSLINAVAADSTQDRTMRMAYDAANRLVFSLDAVNTVTQRVYDAVGNVVKTITYATPITLSGVPDAKAIANTLVVSAQDHVNRAVYDAANRAVYDIDGLGNVTERQYDAAGNAAAVLRRAVPLALASLAEQPTVAQLKTLVTTNASDRLERQIFDADNRLRYSIDAAGFVTQNDYDALGRITKTTQYANRIALATTGLTEQALTTALQPNREQDRVNTFAYDTQGNLINSTDALGGQESYTYDALGRKLSFTNKKGATWDYQYDAAGRMIAELAPQVEAANLVAYVDGEGKTRYRAETGLVRPQTRIAYDAFGNVIARTEAAGTAQERTTRYEYDAQGHQIRTIFPRVAVYDAAADSLSTAGAAARVETAGVELSSYVAYDALGNAVMSIDAAGNRSYKTYDRAGRVAYEIDAKGFVTRYERNAFGDVTALTRYADTLKIAGVTTTPLTQAHVQVAQLYAGLLNRPPSLVELNYNADAINAGRSSMVSIAQTLIDSSEARNNAQLYPVNLTNPQFVARVYQLVLGRAVDAATVAKWSAQLDSGIARGRVAVDILNSMVSYAGTATEELTRQAQFNNKVSSVLAIISQAQLNAAGVATTVAGFNHAQDRVIRTQYDTLGRTVKVIEPQAYSFDQHSVLGSQYFTAGKATETRYNAFGEAVRQSVYGEDAQGVRTTQSADTSFYFNARGEKIAQVVEESEADGKGGQSRAYLSAMEYDAAGNLTRQIDYANAIASWNDASYDMPQTSQDDRETRYVYDRNNRKIAQTRINVEFSTAANGSSTHGNTTTTFAYDAVGNLTRTTDALGNAAYTYYDALGRVSAVVASSAQARSQVAALYAALLNRAPDLKGLAHGGDRLNNGMSLADLATEILNSMEGQTVYPPNLGNAEFITKLYKIAQGRNPDAEGLTFWTDMLRTSSRGKVAADIIQIVMNYSGSNPAGQASEKFFNGKVTAGMTALAAVATKVTQLYSAIFNRAPDLDSLDSWVKAVQNKNKPIDQALAEVADAMLATTDAQTLYPAGQTNIQFITKLYKVALSRDPDSDGLSTWTQAISNGASRGKVVADILDIAANYTGSNPDGIASKKFFNDKVAAALGDFVPAIGGLSPLAEFKRDIYGNVVHRTDYALGAIFADGSTYALTQQHGNDRSTLTVYDSHGHAIQTIDAEGNSAFASYDKSGQVAKQWQTVTGNDGVTQTTFKQMRYDALGQLVELVEPDAGGAKVQHGTEYNAFGEVVRKSVNGNAYEYADYDNAGHMWRTNSGDGVDKVMLYDIEGQATAEIRSVDYQLKSGNYASPAEIVKLDKLLRTETRYDLKGRAIGQIRPTQYSTDVANTLQSAFVTVGIVSRTANVVISSNDSGDTRGWTGNNEVKLNWMSLAGWGSGDVKVQLDYESDPVIDGEFNAFYGIQSAPAHAASYTQIFAAGQAVSGVTLSWPNGNQGDRDTPSVDNIKRIQVWKKDIKGEWVRIIDQTQQGAFGSFISIEAPVDPDVTVSLQYRVLGSECDFKNAGLSDFGDKLILDTTGLPEGSYEYRVLRQGLTDTEPVVADNGTLSVSLPMRRKQIAQLYVMLFNRAPDRGELKSWVSQLASGVPLSGIAKAMIESEEWHNLYPNGLNNAGLIRSIYTRALGREPNQGELEAWAGLLGAAFVSESETAYRGKIIVQMIEAIEASNGAHTFGEDTQKLFNNKVDVALNYAIDIGGNSPTSGAEILKLVTKDDKTAALQAIANVAADERMHIQIAQFYVGLLNRAPDHDGLEYWFSKLKSGTPIGDIVQSILTSSGGKEVYPPTLDDTQFITRFYNLVLGRNPDANGLTSWLNTAKSLSRGQLAEAMIKAVVQYIGTDRAALTSQRLFNNKVAVGLSYALDLKGNDPAVATALLASVSAAATADAAADVASAATAFLSAQKALDNANAVAAATAMVTAAAAMPLEQKRTLIAQFYIGLLNRAPDVQGLNYWVSALTTGQSIDSIAEVMLANSDAQAIYASTLTAEQFITKFYQVALGRNPDADGLKGWLEKSASMSRVQLATSLINSVVDYTGTDSAGIQSQKLFNNRVAVGLTYALELNGNSVEKARYINSLVTADDTSAADSAALSAASEEAIAAAKNTAAAIEAAGTNMTAAAGASDELVAAANAAASAMTAVAQLSPAAKMRLEVTQLYVALLNRAPSLQELDKAVTALNAGSALGDIAQGLLALTEVQAIFLPGLGNSEFIGKFYQVALGRDPDVQGLAYWLKAMATLNKGQVAVEIIHALNSYDGGDSAALNSKAGFSKRVMDALVKVAADASAAAGTASGNASDAASAVTTAKQIADAAADKAAPNAATVNQAAAQKRLQLTQLYVALLNGAPSLSDLNSWFDKMSTGTTISDVAQSLLQRAEAQALYPSSLDKVAFINKFYQVVLGRNPDQDGLTTWTKALESQSRGQVVAQIITAVINYTGNDQAALMSQRLFNKNVANALAQISADASKAAGTVTDTSSAAATAASNATNKMNEASSALSSAPQAVAVRYQVAQLYVAIVNNRAPDLDGFNYWANQVLSGSLSINGVATSILNNNSVAQAIYPPGLSISDFITKFYNVALGRNPDTDGFKHWLERSSSVSRAQLIVEMVTATINYRGLDPAATASQKLFTKNVADALSSVYSAANTAALNASKAADDAEAARKSAYSDLQSKDSALTAAKDAKKTADNQLTNATPPANLANSILNSSPAYRTQVSQLYMSLLNRPPTLDEMSSCVNALSTGTTFASLAESILGTSEAQSYYPAALPDPGPFVTKFYLRALGRNPDSDGFNYWTSQLKSGQTRGQVVAAAINITWTFPAGISSEGDFSRDYLKTRVSGAMSTVTSSCNSLIGAKTAAEGKVLQAQSDLTTAQTNYDNAYRYYYNTALPNANSTASAASTAKTIADWTSSANSIANTYYTAATLAVTASDAAIAAATSTNIINAAKEFIAATATAAKASYQSAQAYSVVLTAAKDAASTVTMVLNDASLAATATRDAANLAISKAANARSVAASASTISPEAQRRTQLAQLYVALLDRNPDLDGFNYWEYSLASGTPIAAIAQEFLNSSTGKTLYPVSMSNGEFLTKLYNVALKRNPDADGLAYWSKELESRSRAQVAVDVINALSGYIGINTFAVNSSSYFNHRVANALAAVGIEAKAAATPEGTSTAIAKAISAAIARAKAAATINDTAASQAVAATLFAQYSLSITELYVTLLGRAPDFETLSNWAGRMQSGATMADVANAILSTAEARKLYPDGLEDMQFINRIYTIQQNHLPDADGLAHWTNALQSRSRGQVVVDIINAVMNYDGTNVDGLTSQNLFQNHVFVALQSVLKQAPAGVAAAKNAAAISAAAASAAADIAARTLLDPVAMVTSGFTSPIVGAQKIATTPLVTQKFDRWGNVVEITDARNPNWVTKYKYNANNQLIEEAKPDANGQTNGASPTTKVYYDQLGRTVATRDARGYVNGKQYDSNGNLLKELQADGGVVEYTYNNFGDRTRVKQANGTLTSYTYDHLGHITSTNRGTVDVYGITYLAPDDRVSQPTNPIDLATPLERRALIDTYRYDELGRRISSTNAAGETTTIGYDLRGNVISTKEFDRETRSEYDAFNHKVKETDANGNSMTWQVDANGRLISHVDLGGATVNYEYNKLNQLKRQTNSRGQNLIYTYDEAGLLTRIEDTTLGQVTEYRYDLAGNRLREKTTQQGVVVQDNHLGYDTQGRLVSVDDGRYSVRYAYDANGNRTNVHTRYINDSDEVKDIQNWNAYDEMNRQTIIDGVRDANGNIGINDKQGHSIAYDKSGNRTSDTYYGRKIVKNDIPILEIVSGGDGGGDPVYKQTTVTTFNLTSGYIKETYAYDAANRLTDVYRDDFDLKGDGKGINIDARRYDAAGRVVYGGMMAGYNLQAYANDDSKMKEYGHLNKLLSDKLRDIGLTPESRTSVYENGLLKRQNSRDFNFSHTTDLAYDYDKGGNLKSYDLISHSYGFTNHYDYSYEQREGYNVKRIDVKRVGKGTVGATINDFDANGNLIKVDDTTKDENDRTLVNDVAGHVLLKTQGNALRNMLTVDGLRAFKNDGNQTHALIVNGEMLGSSSNSGAPDTFSINYVAVNAPSLTAPPSSYVVHAGDTLQGIARAVWGDGNLWYLIAEANGLSGNATVGNGLTEGQAITIPSRTNTVHNDFSTSKPYDPSSVVGDTTPNLPMPANDGCGGMGQIIVIVVAVVASVFLGPEMLALAQGVMGGAGIGATMAAGALTGAASSVIAQGVGMAIGAQDGFNWKGVALSAIGGGIAAGMNGVPGAASGEGGATFNMSNMSVFDNAVGKAVITNAMTQGIGVMTGLQSHFDWRGIAASAAGMSVGQEVGQGLQDTAFADTFGKFGVGMAASFAGGMTAAALRGGAISVQQLAADAFGNALSSSLVENASSLFNGSEQENKALGSGVKVRSDIWGGTTRYGDYTPADLSLTANGVPKLPTQTGDVFDWEALNGLLPQKEPLQAFELSAGANGQAVPRYTGGYVNGYKAPASASGWQGFVEGVRGEGSVMETPTTAKTLGGYVRTGGQILNSMFNPKEIAQGMWNAIDSGNPVEMGVAAMGFLPMGTVGKGAGAVERALLRTESGMLDTTNALRGEIARLEQEGHALARHGGAITDQQLFTRATTGVAPDGSSLVKNGQVVIPPSSSAFNSDALLAQSDLFIRQNYLDRAIALSKPGTLQVAVEGVDMGMAVGRGFNRVSSAFGAVGPLQFNNNLSRATAVYQYDSAATRWRTITIYPTK